MSSHKASTGNETATERGHWLLPHVTFNTAVMSLGPAWCFPAEELDLGLWDSLVTRWTLSSIPVTKLPEVSPSGAPSQMVQELWWHLSSCHLAIPGWDPAHTQHHNLQIPCSQSQEERQDQDSGESPGTRPEQHSGCDGVVTQDWAGRGHLWGLNQLFYSFLLRGSSGLCSLGQ